MPRCIWCREVRREVRIPKRPFCHPCWELLRPFVSEDDKIIPRRNWPKWIRDEFKDRDAERKRANRGYRRYEVPVDPNWLDDPKALDDDDIEMR